MRLWSKSILFKQACSINVNMPRGVQQHGGAGWSIALLVDHKRVLQQESQGLHDILIPDSTVAWHWSLLLIDHRHFLQGQRHENAELHLSLQDVKPYLQGKTDDSLVRTGLLGVKRKPIGTALLKDGVLQ